MDAPKHLHLDLILTGINQHLATIGNLVTLADVANWINYRLVKAEEREAAIELATGTNSSDQDRDDAASLTMEDGAQDQFDAFQDDPWDYYFEEVYSLGEQVDPNYLKPLIQQPDELGELGYVAPKTPT